MPINYTLILARLLNAKSKCSFFEQYLQMRKGEKKVCKISMRLSLLLQPWPMAFSFKM
jgi:hypothetical protein